MVDLAQNCSITLGAQALGQGLATGRLEGEAGKAVLLVWVARVRYFQRNYRSCLPQGFNSLLAHLPEREKISLVDLEKDMAPVATIESCGFPIDAAFLGWPAALSTLVWE